MYDNHIRLTVSGVFQSGSPDAAVYEAWSYRVNFSDQGLVDVDNYSESRLADFVADVESFHQDPNAGISNTCRLYEVKLARIGPDGKYRADPIIAVRTGLRGGGPGLPHPPQIALAVSLGTDRRGPTGRGRFYLPGVSWPVDPDTGLMPVANRLAVATRCQGFLNALNDVPGLDDPGTSRVVVASSKGYNTDVTSVRVGQAFDTIRSRRRSLEETYGAPLPVG